MAEATQYPPSAESLLAILERLRAPGGCPWDREQTRETLSRSLAEECAEFLDAADRNAPDDIRDELGDLFMNVLFQCVVAAERGEFTYRDMAEGIIAKMIRRHAHIFGNASAGSAEEVAALWEKIKKEERSGAEKPQSVLDGAGHYLTALNRAEKLQKKAAKVGFDWSDSGAIVDKIQEELDELRSALADGDAEHADEELGDLLFAAVNLARFRKRQTAEELLRRANRKFETRFRSIERALAEEGIPVAEAGIDRLEALWQQAKNAERIRN